jgi:hypothetical protein
MDNQTRYAFCIEMGNLARANGRKESTNKWYSRAWHLLLEGTEYADKGEWRAFWEVDDEKTN